MLNHLNHKFINTHYELDIEYFTCVICKIICFTNSDKYYISTYDSVLSSSYHASCLKLTCEEVIIKSIIE